ncbi:MAG: hypothetical protein KL863_05145 [Rhizobium sp.]|nr:hypothetical protein [Rhizobium sp.]
MTSQKNSQPRHVRQANDAYRTALDPALGGCAVSPQIMNLPPFMREAILRGIMANPIMDDSIHSKGRLHLFGRVFLFMIFAIKRLKDSEAQWLCEDLSTDPTDERKTWRHMAITTLEEGGDVPGFYHAAL